jgi:hypothetical protein
MVRPSRVSDDAWVRALLVAIVAAAAAAAGPVPVSPPAAAQSRGAAGESYTFAVLRRDGVIVPFASYDAGRWLDRWPEPGWRIDIPISLESTPKSWWLHDTPAAAWTAWPVQGESRAIHVRNPVNLTVQCSRHVGLQTDYSSIAPPVARDMQPHPKDGLATTGDVAVERVDVLAASSPEWARVLEAVKEPFAAAEAKAISKGDRNFEKDPKRRAQYPVEIEVLFRSPGAKPGTQVLYFEAVRRYGRRPAGAVPVPVFPDRRPLTFGAGWAETDAAGTVSLRGQVLVELSDNERENLLYALPLGAFQLGERRYWAAQVAGWGYERYEILEIAGSGTKVSFKTAGGTCR